MRRCAGSTTIGRIAPIRNRPGTANPSAITKAATRSSSTTIGQNDKTFVDNYRTPHTTQMHVIERFKLIDGGRTIEVSVHVEDPGAFTTPWNAIQRYRRTDDGPMVEMVCAENNTGYFTYDVVPLPHADKADF
jgi:hypothetical protein